MNQAQLSARPFAFDTEFDASGRVVASGAPIRTVKRTYLAAEVEALVAQARAEARTEALAEAESMRSMALGEIGRAACEAAATLTAVALAHRADSAALAMAAARTMAGGALERCPEAPLSRRVRSRGRGRTGQRGAGRRPGRRERTRRTPE